MTMKTRIHLALIVLLSLTLAPLGVYAARQYFIASEREDRDIFLRKELLKADAIVDDAMAVEAYKKLTPVLPEIQVRIVQRQWRMALELMRYLQRAGNNAELKSETGAFGAQLKTLLDRMLERCATTLADGASLRPEILWQVYNAAGSAKVLSAFVMLETEQNLDKVQGVMREALTDYKASIEAVDKAGLPPAQKNIPRWNFELLNGEGSVQKYEVSTTDMEKNQALKENLETLIPEIGGYAPGEPIDTRVKK
ncbi:MAG: hypothetical protein HXX11_16370 [Desulfuromonadales bacterium]|nr:hypothetical protein [Desulfuromonadales bacterium]